MVSNNRATQVCGWFDVEMIAALAAVVTYDMGWLVIWHGQNARSESRARTWRRDAFSPSSSERSTVLDQNRSVVLIDSRTLATNRGVMPYTRGRVFTTAG